MIDHRSPQPQHTKSYIHYRHTQYTYISSQITYISSQITYTLYHHSPPTSHPSLNTLTNICYFTVGVFARRVIPWGVYVRIRLMFGWLRMESSFRNRTIMYVTTTKYHRARCSFVSSVYIYIENVQNTSRYTTYTVYIRR
jgi:hypothetical protein